MTTAAPTFLELRIGARLAAVRTLNELLEVALRALGIEDPLRHDVTLGVAELVANVVEHERGDAEVGVRLDVAKDEVRLTVHSVGPRFDLQAALARAGARDPLSATDEGGLGLLILAGLFDEVRLDEAPAGNRIVLRKAR
jgi:anti-sigma regulatory factor (Ser/Thr protein kinase)